LPFSLTVVVATWSICYNLHSALKQCGRGDVHEFLGGNFVSDLRTLKPKNFLKT